MLLQLDVRIHCPQQAENGVGTPTRVIHHHDQIPPTETRDQLLILPDVAPLALRVAKMDAEGHLLREE